MRGIGAARRRILQLHRPDQQVEPVKSPIETLHASLTQVKHHQPPSTFVETHDDESNKENSIKQVAEQLTETKEVFPSTEGSYPDQGRDDCTAIVIEPESKPKPEPEPVSITQKVGENKTATNDEDSTDVEDEEWDQLGKIPYEQRKKFLRDITTVPHDQSGDASTYSIETKKHKIQMLLAEHKYGIPSLALAEEYEKMYGQKFDIQEWGYELLSNLIADMADIITVQEPDEISCLYHPKYPNDRILLDKRFGHQFTSQPPININRVTSTSGIGSACESDYDTLISQAKINHDCEFPEDVVLPGEQYSDPILMKTAQVAGTRGVYTCLITGAANPHHLYVNVKNDYTKTIETFSSQVKQYFEENNLSLEAYRVPEEFIYPGFACLRQRKKGPWERVLITGRSLTDHKIFVESVDFGGTDAVSPKYLRLMPREFMSASRQAIVVSMFGVKPMTEKWSSFSGKKIAGWSYEYYWMECLFLEPRSTSPSIEEGTTIDDESNLEQQSGETGSSMSSREEQKKMSINKRIMYRKPQFEVIILDRMIPSYNAFVDEVLVAQMLASYVEEYQDELKRLKSEMIKAVEDVPRNDNPMEKSFKENGHV